MACVRSRSASGALAARPSDDEHLGRPAAGSASARPAVRRPRSTSTASRSSFALPTARPSGACIEVSQATARQPMSRASSTRVSREQLGGLPGPHERARAHLHVEHQPVQILGELLAQDARRDERDGVHRRGDVAEGVEPPVGRRELLGLPEHAHAQLAQDAIRLVAARGRCGSRGWPRACPACRRCGRARGRSSSARQARRRRPAGRGKARPCPPPRRWSACPPVGGEPGERRSALPEWSMASVQRAQLVPVEAPEVDGHAQRSHLVVGDVAARVGGQEGAKRLGERVPPSRLARMSSYGVIRASCSARLSPRHILYATPTSA